MKATRMWFIRKEDRTKADSPYGKLNEDGDRVHNVRYLLRAANVEHILEAARRVKRGGDYG